MIISGGGTGGHLFPALAIAEEFKGRNKDNDVLFLGSRKGIEARILPVEGWALRFISSGGIKGKGPMAVVGGLMKMILGTLQSMRYICDFRPSLVLGMGGYVSAPAIIAGRMKGIKTAIHEQNAMPGLANRLLGRVVHKVFLTYPESERFFSPCKVVVSGNPVRKKIVEAFSGLEVRKVKEESFTLLIFGGSRGARKLNEVVPAAVAELETKGLKGLKIIHQSGDEDFEMVKNAYGRTGADVKIYKFIDDMAEAYAHADLVICRAGATSIAELLAAGKASILIPYPYAADDHQRLNAEAVVHGGAARMILDRDLSAQSLVVEVSSLYENMEGLSTMSEMARNMSRPEASSLICDALGELVS